MRLELTHLHLRILIGVGIKTLGYLIIAAGIFLSIRDKGLALRAVYLGISLVVVGWFVVIRSLRLARVVKVPKTIGRVRKTKISASISARGGIISEGEEVKVKGFCKYYDPNEKKWKDLNCIVKILLDNSEIEKIYTSGSFTHSFLAPKKGEHTLELRIISEDFEPSYKILKFKVLSRDEKMKILKLTYLAYTFLILFLLVFIVFVLNLFY